MLTCGSVIDDKEEPSSDAHAVSVQKANTQQGSDGSIHSRAVFPQNVPGNKRIHLTAKTRTEEHGICYMSSYLPTSEHFPASAATAAFE